VHEGTVWCSDLACVSDGLARRTLALPCTRFRYAPVPAVIVHPLSGDMGAVPQVSPPAGCQLSWLAATSRSVLVFQQGHNSPYIHGSTIII
jgi:hypothetical protein